MNTKEIGNLAEDKAVEFLIKNNFTIVDRNFYSRYGEIDIIAKKDKIYHFIEVKSGRNFQSIYNITPSKIEKFTKTMQVYLKQNKINTSYQIDAITIDNQKIEFIENITLF